MHAYHELVAAVLAIEIAAQKGWTNLWLETDSMLIAFQAAKVVPWSLRNRWDDCLSLSIISKMDFFVTHI
jgi:ribonuclease HI